MGKFNNILLVDDDEISNYLNESILKDLGFANNIAAAYNGLEALNFIIDSCNPDDFDSCPDLIFLDIKMPVMDGFEFLEAYKRLKILPKEIKIYMLTSSNNENDLLQANRYPIEGYINKPLTEEKIRLKVF